MNDAVTGQDASRVPRQLVWCTSFRSELCGSGSTYCDPIDLGNWRFSPGETAAGLNVKLADLSK